MPRVVVGRRAGVVDAADGRKIRFATSADLERFEQLLLDTLNG
jgi:hypothetical protein